MKPIPHLLLGLSLGFALAVPGCVNKSMTNSRAAMTSPMGPTDADAPQEFETTSTGLRYRILRKSTSRLPNPNNTVTVHYKGWLDDGTVFDSSYDRGEPFVTGLNEVIAGWTEGMQYVGEGGMIELEIPPNLGYGSRGAGQLIPPNARLHFIVEMIQVQ
jgi:FKBP-type peptidyl-prolyl cis-trans isomerase